MNRADTFLDIMMSANGKSVHEFEKSLVELNPLDRVAYAILYLAESVSDGCRHLGLQDASTPMGAIEALGKSVDDGLHSIASAIEISLASAIEDK